MNLPDMIAIVWLFLVCLGVLGLCGYGLYRITRGLSREDRWLVIVIIGLTILTIASILIGPRGFR